VPVAAAYSSAPSGLRSRGQHHPGSSGSPKRALNSTTRRPREVNASPAVEQADERGAAPAHLVHGGLQDALGDVLEQPGRNPSSGQ